MQNKLFKLNQKLFYITQHALFIHAHTSQKIPPEPLLAGQKNRKSMINFVRGVGGEITLLGLVLFERLENLYCRCTLHISTLHPVK